MKFAICAVFAVTMLLLPGINAQQPAAKQPAADSEPAPYSGRLPNNYRKLGLFDKQKKEIYSIQGKYRKQIEALEDQIQALEEKRDQEVFQVLTERQQQYLIEILKEKAKDDLPKLPSVEPKTDE